MTVRHRPSRSARALLRPALAAGCAIVLLMIIVPQARADCVCAGAAYQALR